MMGMISGRLAGLRKVVLVRTSENATPRDSNDWVCKAISSQVVPNSLLPTKQKKDPNLVIS